MIGYLVGVLCLGAGAAGVQAYRELKAEKALERVFEENNRLMDELSNSEFDFEKKPDEPLGYHFSDPAEKPRISKHIGYYFSD